jgi:hypothetical protein
VARQPHKQQNKATVHFDLCAPDKADTNVIFIQAEYTSVEGKRVIKLSKGSGFKPSAGHFSLFSNKAQ